MNCLELIFSKNKFVESNKFNRDDILVLSYFVTGKLSHIDKDFPELTATQYAEKLLALKKKIGVFFDEDLKFSLKKKNQYKIFKEYYELFYISQKLKRFFSEVSMVKTVLNIEYSNVSDIFLRLLEEHLNFFNLKVKYKKVDDKDFYFYIRSSRKVFEEFYIKKVKKNGNSFAINELDSYASFFFLILKKSNFFKRYSDKEGVVRHVLLLRKKNELTKIKSNEFQKSKIRIDLIIAFLFLLFVSLYAFFDFSKKNFVHGFFDFTGAHTFINLKGIDGQIEKILGREEENNKKNVHVIIVGKKGIGKNNLARKHALKSGCDVIWEIDASSRLGILYSFQSLAKAISQTEGEKKELQIINNVSDERNKLNYLLIYVQKILKKTKGWFLIFNNLKEFEGVEKFIPIAPFLWGSGKFIVTMTMGDLQNIDFIASKNIIRIDRILDGEARRLFSQIFYKTSFLHLTKNKQGDINGILKNTPLYFLDIVVVASYLNYEKISFPEYIQSLKTQEILLVRDRNKNFIKNLKGDDFRRYIIFQKIIKSITKKDKRYKNILFFMSYMHFKNVSKSFLYSIFDPQLVESFLKLMKNYSLFHEYKKYCINKPHDFFAINQNFQFFLRQYFFEECDREVFKKNIFSTINILNNSLQKNKLNWCELNADLVINIKKLLKECEKLDSSDPFLKQCQSKVYYLLVKIYMLSTKELNQVKIYLEKILSINDEHQSYDEKIYIYLSLCEICLRLQKPEVALNYIKAGLNHLQKNKDSCFLVSKSKFFYFKGCAYRAIGKIEKAKNYFNEALFILDESLNSYQVKKMKALIKRKQAFLYAEHFLSRKSAFYSANYLMDEFSEAGKINKHSSMTNAELKRHLALGIILCRRGKFHEAYGEVFEKITRKADEILNSDQKVLTNIYLDMFIGECFLRIGKVEKAVGLLKNAVEKGYVIFGQNAKAIFISQVFLMESYLRLNRLDLAEKELMQIMKFDLKEKSNFLSFIKCLLYYNAAILYRENGNKAKALLYFKEFFNSMLFFLKNFLPQNEYKKVEELYISVPSVKYKNQVSQSFPIYISNAKKMLNAVYKNIVFYG